MSPNPLAGSRELVLASAGSGKTFRISSRIIGLLAAGEPPSSVFASTFTRKAAGEILERVLVRLARAAGDPGAAAALAAHVPLAEGAAPTPAFWTGVLAATVRRLHELDVGTLDAFFGRVLRSYAHEAGLPPGWQVADDATLARLRARALERLLASADPGVMIELVRGVRGADAGRSVHEALMGEVGAVAEVHRELAPGAPGWRALGMAFGSGDEDGADDGTPDGDAGGEGLEAEVARVCALLDAAEVKRNADGSKGKRWVDAVAKIQAGLRAGEWTQAIGSSLVSAALPGGDGTYYRAPIPDSLVHALRETVELVRGVVARQLQARAAALARLAARWDAAHEAALFDEGALAFDDVVRLLTREAPLGRTDLSYRLDGRLRHLLLDEFQDTSLLQWRALLPLTDALAGDEAPATGSASVVADPKQSIYGWRGAAPVIVDALRERYPLETETLAVSWRSSPVVLDVVNWTFDDVAGAAVLGANSPETERVDRDTAAAWARNFAPHVPAPRPGDGPALPGHVCMVAGPPLDGRSDFQPKLLAFAADRIAALHRRAPGRSIGVLVRKNDALARLIYELRRRGVAASEEGGTRLADDPAVVSVLALLRLADHPGDALAAYHVARTPLGGVLGEALGLGDPGHGAFGDEADTAAIARVAERVRRLLVHDGYGPTLTRLRDALADRVDARGALRLGQLVELGHRHDERPTLRSDDFVALAEQLRVESAGEAPVRVMTVWGSKGLEFDVVVLPQLHTSLIQGSRGTQPPLAHRPRPTEAVTHLFPPMNTELRTLLAPRVPELSAAWAAHRAGLVRDALSGLYVAMTRARHALHLIVPSDDDKVSGARTAAALLREKLTPDPDEPAAEGEELFAHGDPDWMDTLPPAPGGPDAGAGDEADAYRIALVRASPPRRHLSRRSPSQHDAAALDPEPGADDAGGGAAPEPVAPSPAGPDGTLDLFAPPPDPAAARGAVPPTVKGSVVHAWLEQIDWLADGKGPGDAPALARPDDRRHLVRRAAPELATARLAPWSDDLWDALRPRLAAPAIRERLDAGAMRRRLARIAEGAGRGGGHEGLSLEVRAELRFVMREGDGLVEGIIDRLVLARDADGTVVAAQVLDWKTDAVAASGPPEAGTAPDDAAGGTPANARAVDEALLAERVELYRPQLADYRAAVSTLFDLPGEAVVCELAFLEAGRVVGV